MELNPDIEFIRQLKKNGGDNLKKCMQCATCSCVCNLSPKENAFPRKELLWASWGLKDKLMNDPDLWLCHYCNDCTDKCPRGAKPGNVMNSIRTSVIREYAIPKFMSNSFASPKNLILLLIIPFLLFAGYFYSNISGDLGNLHKGSIVFAKFFPHNILEFFWIGGNVLIFAAAALSLIKFRKNIIETYSKPPVTAFIPAFIITVKEILFHEKFSDCQNSKVRKGAHLMVMLGFFGAAATAGLALIADLFFDTPAPLSFLNPIKILGNLSGLSVITGCTIFLIQRLQNKDGNWKSTYIDWSFLLFLYIVAITGLGTQFSRIAEIPELAYALYILHMTSIFILLWFVMYSKFAHIFYRTLALITARQYGRLERIKLNVN